MALDCPLEQTVPARALTRALAAKPDIAELESRIGHRFRDPRLLTKALTHVSGAGSRPRVDSYQRLEFLGDRVLGLAVAEMLCELFPAAEEGELSRRLSALVRKETCADVAREWGAAPHVVLGRGEKKSAGGGDGILGDVCESILGAVFLDAGFAEARDLVRRSFGERTREQSVSLDPKTALQEWAQGAGKPPPAYREISRGGPDHNPLFVIAVDVDGYEGARAEGASKRLAEQAAAAAFASLHGLRIGIRQARRPAPKAAAVEA
jgi:ribonuclease-3